MSEVGKSCIFGPGDLETGLSPAFRTVLRQLIGQTNISRNTVQSVDSGHWLCNDPPDCLNFIVKAPSVDVLRKGCALQCCTMSQASNTMVRTRPM